MMRIVLLSMWLLGAVAQAEPCDVISYNPGLPGRDAAFAAVGLARVTGPGAVHFSNCPGAGCTTKPYIMPGDLVLTGRTEKSMVCALFPNRLGGTSGWLPLDRLKPVTVAPNPPLAAWAGNWRRDANADIEIRLGGGALTVDGQAIWQNSPVNVHDGQLEGSTKPVGTVLDLPPAAKRGKDFDPEMDCIARLVLVGPYLLVDDNLRCGGLNVTFTGAYRRIAH